MITMTINELLNTIPILRELINKPFNGTTAFKLARLMRELDKEVLLFEEARQRLAEKYGQRDDNGQFVFDEDGSIKLQEDKLVECNEEMMTLLLTTVDINADKIPLEVFNDITIAPSQIIMINNLIEY